MNDACQDMLELSQKYLKELDILKNRRNWTENSERIDDFSAKFRKIGLLLTSASDSVVTSTTTHQSEAPIPSDSATVKASSTTAIPNTASIAAAVTSGAIPKNQIRTPRAPRTRKE